MGSGWDAWGGEGILVRKRVHVVGERDEGEVAVSGE